MTPTACSVLSLGTRHVGRMVWRFTALPSTNDLALKVAQPGLAIVADHQTRGRGQHDRRWQAPAGSSLLCSLIVDPPPAAARTSLLIAWAATALASFVERISGQPVRLKWPNDLLITGRKVCGILTERQRVAVVGFGLNLNQLPEDFEAGGLPGAASLRMYTGRSYRAADVLPPVMQELDEAYAELLSGDTVRLGREWGGRFGLLEQPVRCVLNDGREIRGKLCRLDFRGLRMDLGEEQPLVVEPERVRALEAL